ncbi:Annexin [Eremomyces bilateralis CBS 781.70]|uniref:Annexin n=1 Tax=Eremomyces bilateralis CBS 781.70 TaxID=1392243 RepID=A0A6G1FVS0_9PEZI|nr:Annexin [Eremomyces bilateralis CBS 781.70]KAF1809884.1 Annexin [Eremomyces bilateralis CBS 781.70]
MGNYSDLPPHERPGYTPKSPDGPGSAIPYPMDGPTVAMPSMPSYTMNPGEVTPGGGKSKSKSKDKSRDKDEASLPPPPSRPHRLSVGREPAELRPRSPGLPRMDRLSVSGNRPQIGEIPPPSPLLEAYHGTYQSISPMPSPVMRAPRFDDDLDLEDLPPLSPNISRSSLTGQTQRPRASSHVRRVSTRESTRESSPPGAKKKKVVLYSNAAEEEARDIAGELSRSSPNFRVLSEILPILSHDQMLQLRAAYKKVCRIQGKGINIAKHIKMKVSGPFGKIAHVTALGRWESESYWANSWYQSNNARRELLIESLMGRTNAEIREIKRSFHDKRYGDSLMRCMDKELKADKFRTAILLALEERRQEENESWGTEERNRDVDALYRSLKEGRETAMLNVVVLRSDAHLREVLRTYERMHRRNFAKEALKKSNNLVGEVVAHILNGVINKPARDAMLLHHAVEDLSGENSSSRDSRHVPKDRYELLISRLVRLHWDRVHLHRVKDEYRELYRKSLERDIDERTRGDFRDFCIALCEGGR